MIRDRNIHHLAFLVGLSIFLFGIGGKIPELQAVDSDALIREGIALRRADDDAAALKLFQRAYELNKTPKALAQIGFAEQALGRWTAADVHLRQALESSDDPWIRKNRGSIDRSLAIIATHVGQIEISGAPAGAEVRVDGELVGRLPLARPVTATAGGVAVEVRAPGYLTIVRATTVGARILTRETFTLQPASPIADPPPAQSTSSAAPRQEARAVVADRNTSALSGSSDSPSAGALPPESNPAHAPADSAASNAGSAGGGTKRGLALVAGGLSAASLVFGIIEHVTWQRRVDSFGSNHNCGTTFVNLGEPGCKALYDGGQHARTLTFVGYGLTGAFAATALILYLTDSTPGSEPGKVACAPALEPSSVSCAFRF